MPIDDPEAYIDAKRRLYNRLYRSSLLILVLVITAFAIVGVHQIYVTSRQISEGNNEIQKSLRCISEFFTQTNRANLKVTDINKCTLVRE